MTKKNLYHKSRYYRKRQQQIKQRIAIAVAVFAILCLVLIIRGCISRKSAAASARAEQKKTEQQKEAELTKAATKSPISLTVSVVGDCTLGTDEEFDYDTSLNAYYDNNGADYFFANVRDIFSADNLTVANFEGTLTDSEEREDKQFAFKAPASYADILTAGSVEAVNTANNHSHDYGEQSFKDTLAALDADNIIHFGYDETAVTLSLIHI